MEHPTSSESAPAVPALEVRGLSVSIKTGGGEVIDVLNDVTFSVAKGQTMAIVGESGSGKTLTGLAVMGLMPRNAVVKSGQILLHGEDLLVKNRKEMRKVRGSRISMVLQDPMMSLDPSFTIGNQLAESFRLHQKLDGREIRSASVSLLERLHIPFPRERLRQYPHQLSGGMRQRVSSAISLAGEPSVLIADEPTTALDVTTQAQYLALLSELQASTGFALVLITHDLSVVRNMCEQVVVMYAGQVVERGPLEHVVKAPQHPYTRALFESLPSMDYGTRLATIEGQSPDPSEYAGGCRFSPRCSFVRPICISDQPELSPRSEVQWARCFGTSEGGWIQPTQWKACDSLLG